MLEKIVTVFLLPLLALDLILYFLSFAWWSKLTQTKRRMQSTAYGEATDTHGAPRRSTGGSDLLSKGNQDETTLYEMSLYGIKEYKDKTAMVSQTFVKEEKIHKTDRFPTKIYDSQRLRETSFTQLGENLHNFGAGLRTLGMEPSSAQQADTSSSKNFELDGKAVMVLFEDTCEQWTTAFQGVMSQSLTVATCYATLGTEAVINAVNETSATTLFLNWKKASEFAKLQDRMPSLRTIVASTHELPEGSNDMIPTNNDKTSRVRIVSYDEVMRIGIESQISPVAPKASDVAVIMYTSGSTGKPKGVLMTHQQLVAGVTGMARNLDVRRGEEVFVAYLPLAHILALQVENGMIHYGAKICYSDPRQLPKALPFYKPTVFAGVPKVWDLLKGGMEKKLSERSPVLKAIFDVLVAWKTTLMRKGWDTPVSNVFFRLVSSKVFGTVLRFGVSGGGPISPKLQEFCRAVFCCPLVQGYALTETCVGGCFQALDDERPGIVGPPVPCVEVALQSEPEIMDGPSGLPYLHTDRVSSTGEAILGRGEVCFRGPCVTSGYYKLPEKTAEAYDKEGWFHSGDIGQFTSDGVLQIIDRKKNLVKLRGGEYVQVESMEVAFGQSPFISAICVVANGDLDSPFVIVNADVAYLKKWAADNNVTYQSLDDLAAKDDVRKAAVKSMVAAGKEAGLTSLELRVKDCCIIAGDEWGPGHGMTASMKMDRKQIFKIHEKELKAMFERNGVETSL